MENNALYLVETPSQDVIDYAFGVVESKLALQSILPASAEDYRKSLRAFVPYLRGVSLSSLTRQQVEGALKGMLSSGKSPNTVLKRYVALNMALEHAVKVGDAARNVMDGIPRPQKIAPEQNPIVGEDLERLKSLLGGICERPWGVAVALCLYGGLRIEEACALKVSDVDFPSRMLRIRRAIGYGKGGSYVAPTKGKKQRSVPIPDALDAILRRWITLNQASSLSYGGDSWLLPSPSGGYLDARGAGRDWTAFCKLYGLRGLAGRKPSLHDLRHTYATRMVGAGMDVKLLQEILGHASAAITLDVYTSVEDASKRAACSLIQAAM